MVILSLKHFCFEDLLHSAGGAQAFGRFIEEQDEELPILLS